MNISIWISLLIANLWFISNDGIAGLFWVAIAGVCWGISIYRNYKKKKIFKDDLIKNKNVILKDNDNPRTKKPNKGKGNR